MVRTAHRLLLTLAVGASLVAGGQGAGHATTGAATAPLERQWVEQLGGTCGDSTCGEFGQAVAIGPDGTRYTAGTFAETLTLGRGGRTVTLIGDEQDETTGYLAAYDPVGNLTWARRIALTGSIGSYSGIGLAPSPDGGLFVSGDMVGAIDLGNGVAVDLGPYVDGAYIASFSGDGTARWIQVVETQSAHSPSAAVTPDGDVVFTGQGYGTMTFSDDRHPITLPGTDGRYESFVASYSAAGALRWATRIGGTGYEYGADVDIAPNGTVVATGTFEGVATFGDAPGAPSLTSHGSSDVYLATFGDDGIALRAQSIGSEEDDDVSGAAIGPGGTVSVFGRAVTDEIYFEDTDVPTQWDDDLFLAEYAANGDFLRVDPIGGGTPFGNKLYSGGVDVGTDGTRYVTAEFRENAVIGSGPSAIHVPRVKIAARRTYSGLVAAIAADGTVQWVAPLLEAEMGFGEVATGPEGTVLSTGSFQSWPATFPEGNGTQTLTTRENRDAFLSQIVPTSSRARVEAVVTPRSVPSSGGSITISATITNVGVDVMPYDLSADVTGAERFSRRLATGTLVPGASVTHVVPVSVSASRPDGDYAIDVNVGDRPTLVIYAQDQVSVRKGE